MRAIVTRHERCYNAWNHRIGFRESLYDLRERLFDFGLSDEQAF
jgi:hypothetical protein